MLNLNNLLARFKPTKKKLSGYNFRKPKDGYLVYRRNLHPHVRTLAEMLLCFLKYIDGKREENLRANKLIFESLGLPPDTKVNELDAFHKREFRKKKYIQRPVNKATKQLTEPKKIFQYIVYSDEKEQNKLSSSEFLKSFRAKN